MKMDKFENFLHVGNYVINLNNVKYFFIHEDKSVSIFFDKEHKIGITDPQFYNMLMKTKTAVPPKLFD